MIKRQRRWIALLVALTFMWLLQVSSMPLTAGSTAEQVAAANHELGPSFIEQSGAAAGKKSILPSLLIVLGAAAVAAVLVLVVFKTTYDITGTWVITYGTGKIDAYTFVGTKESGTYTTSDALAQGTYAVDGKNVTLTWTGWGPGLHIDTTSWEFTGKFDSKTTMSGTYSIVDFWGPSSSTWSAVRK